MQVGLIVLITFVFCLIGYLFGSIMFGVIIAHFFNKDIRNIGSNNPGATNISRTLSKKVAIIVSLLDAFKGYLAIIVCWIIFRFSIFDLWSSRNYNLLALVFLSGTMSVIGHCFPIQYVIALFRFKFNLLEAKKYSGGKGVSTTGGVLFAISPWLGIIAFGIWICTLLITRYVSVSSMLCMSLPAFLVLIDKLNFLYLFNRSLLFPDQLNINWSIRISLFILMLINALIVIIRHHSNIKRLMQHQERKVF